MQFDMNRTWSQAIALVKGNFQLLALIAGIFLLLPGLIMIVAMPEFMAVASPAAADPDALQQQLNAIGGTFVGAIIVIMLVSFVGYAAMVALMGPDRPTVGTAITRGLKALPTIVGAFIIFAIAYVLLVLVLGLVFGLLAAALSAATESGGPGLLMALGILLVVSYILSRLSVTLPTIVLEGVLNPFTAFIRSWRLTGRAHLRIWGFFLLLAVAYFVLALLLMFVVSGVMLASGLSTGGLFAFGIVSGLLGMLVAMIVSAIVVSIHQQLAGPSEAVISETFE